MHRKSPTKVLDRPARVTGIIAIVVMVIVMLGTVLIVAPAGTPLRSEVRSAATPYFVQNWRVFAPNILKVNRTLEMRAQWRDGEGELVTSDWVSITDIELRTAHGNMAPSRIQKSSLNSSQSYFSRYNNLEKDQRKRARDTFIETHDGGFRAIPPEDLIAELGEDDGDVIRFLRMDYMMMRYTTLYATAGFNAKIERVQWRVARERPNDFTHRFDEDTQFTPNVTTFGWRQSTVGIEADVVNEFRAVIERFGAEGTFERAADDAE